MLAFGIYDGVGKRKNPGDISQGTDLCNIVVAGKKRVSVSFFADEVKRIWVSTRHLTTGGYGPAGRMIYVDRLYEVPTPNQLLPYQNWDYISQRKRSYYL